MDRRIDLATLVAALRESPPHPSSDYELNPEIVLPPGRVLKPAAVLIGVVGESVVLTKRA